MCIPTDNYTPSSRTEMINMLKCLYTPSTRKSRVRFAPVETSSAAPHQLCADQYEEVKDGLWYSQAELKHIKSEARKLVRSGSLERGFENCTMERQKHRHMTVRCTVNAHRQCLGANHTAMVSKRCSEWSEEAAFVQACHDYCNVYHPNMTSAIPEFDNTPPQFPFGSNKRTSCADEVAHERRVRRRLASA